MNTINDYMVENAKVNENRPLMAENSACLPALDARAQAFPHA